MALSNTTTSALNTEYYDDFYEVANTTTGELLGTQKDFHRVLFRPKYGVQSRELTQLQTLLQKQLERLGTAQFRDGDRVVGGQLSLDTQVISGQVLTTTTLTNFFDRDTNLGKYVLDSSANTTIKAHITQYVSVDDNVTSSDIARTSNNYLLFQYATVGRFGAAGTIQDRNDASITATFASGANASIFSAASTISIDEGVCFVSGLFVRIRPQTIVLNPLSNMPSYRIGFTVSEELVNEEDDDSLLDSANQGAPGAHRLRIRLALDKHLLTSTATANFIELAQIVDGVVQSTAATPRYLTTEHLNQTLARRTYDESGDYIVKRFAPVIEGASTANSTNSADVATFVLSVGQGKAYVRGREVELLSPIRKTIKKGRTTAAANNRVLATTVGNYALVSRLAALTPNSYFANTSTVDLHCVPISNVVTTSDATYNLSKIGTTKVRMVEFETGPTQAAIGDLGVNFANNSVYKLFFYDTTFSAPTGNVTSAAANGTSATTLTIDAATRTTGVFGLPATIDGAIDGASIVLSGASSPVTGTFTVNNYVANSTASFLTLKEFLPTLPNANTQYRLLFRARDIDAFALPNTASDSSRTAPFYAGFAFQADVAAIGRDDGTPTGNTTIFDTNDNSLLYQIPEVFVKANSITIANTSFTTWLQSSANTRTFSSASNGNLSLIFTTSQSGGAFSLPSGNLTASTAQEYFTIFDTTDDALGRGRIVPFADVANVNSTNRCVSTTSLSGGTFSFTYHHAASTSATRTFTAVGKALVTHYPVRTKTYYVGNTTVTYANTASAATNGQIEFHTLNTTPGFAYSLKTPDVTRICKVLYHEGSAAFANNELATATDVSTYFTLDTGQRDNTYEYSRMIVRNNASTVIKPTGRLLVIFDWFKHEGLGYATVDSYLSWQNVEKGMTYDDIPFYTSPKYDRTVNLRDVLDFRPTRSNLEYANGSIAMVFAAANASSNTAYTDSDNNPYLIPVSDDIWTGTYEYYLGRIDRVAIYADNTIHVTEGLPDARAMAMAPTVDPNGLLLYEIAVEPYTTVNDAGVPYNASVRSFEHKRFTMEDVTRVEARVRNLEYYTALSGLERRTRDTTILDADNLERFKNGIVVDSFASGNLADLAKSDFAAAIDMQKQVLWPSFKSTNFQFTADTANTGTSHMTIVGDMAIPTYNATGSFITQSLATHAVSVNPFNIGTFFGNVQLSPAVDIWKSTSGLPAQVIEVIDDASRAWMAAPTPYNMVWGEWETTWAGERTEGGWSDANEGDSGAVWNGQEWRTNDDGTEEKAGDSGLRNWGGSWSTWQDGVNIGPTRNRQGTRFSYTARSTVTSQGNRIVDSSVIHNVRARDIVFASDGLQPGATMYPFFDDVSVTNYVQQANVLKFAPVVTATRPTFYIGQTVYVQKALTGNVATTNGSATITGTSTEFDFEARAGQFLRITSGVTTFDRLLSTTANNTSATLVSTAPTTLANATAFTLTPVTVASVTSRVTGANTEFTLKIVRAARDVDQDGASPYAITAGSLRPEKNVKDATSGSLGATLIVPVSTRNTSLATMNVNTAVITSGVVRSYTTNQLRLDTDITDSKVTVGATIHFVSNSAAGQSTTVVSYNAATQTATVASQVLTDIVAGSTIYSVGDMTADGYLASGSVTAGGAGTVAGVLHMQDSQFATGKRVFRVTDSATNVVADATSSAETFYTAEGLAVVEQEFTTSTRSVDVVRTSVREDEVDGHRTGTTWYDPLAETILVDRRAYPQGVFVTSIDLSFSAKPADDIPVTVELRPTVNGYPSSNRIVSCAADSGQAVATLRMEDVNTSTTPDFDTASHYTRFTFPALVHLLPGEEYAIVVHSNSDEYKVYTAELGQTLLGTDQKVSKQPYAGAFFKSQNGSTWTETPLEDLMFRVNRATWTVSAGANTGVLVMRAVQPATNTVFDRLSFYAHEVRFPNTTSTTYALSIKPESTTAPGTLDANASAVAYTTFNDESYTLDSRSLVQGYATVNATGSSVSTFYPSFANNAPAGTVIGTGSANTIDMTATLTTTSTDVAPYIDLKKVNVITIKHLINNLTLTANQFMVVNPSLGYPSNVKTGTVTTSSTSNVVTGTATLFTNTLVVGESVVVGGNMAMTVASITTNTSFVATANATETRTANTYGIYEHLTLTIANSATGNGATGFAVVAATSVSDVTGVITGVTLAANATSTVLTGGDGYTTTPTVALPTYTLTGTAGNTVSSTGLVGSGTLFTTELEVGNVLLLGGNVEATVASITNATHLVVTSAFSAAIAANTVALSGNNGSIIYHSEDFTSGGNALARYFIKPVTLATGFDARDLKVYFDAVRPSGTNLYVYYKVLSGTADTARIEDQSWRLMVQDTNDGLISSSDRTFHEFEFSTSSNQAADGTADTTDKFRMFAIKIVMATDDTTVVPNIKNFRAIALDQ